MACSLSPATQYRFIVSASTRAGYGPGNWIDLYTTMSQPPAPNPPIVIAIGQTTIVLRLQPIAVIPGPTITSYFVVVNDLQQSRGRRRRMTLDDWDLETKTVIGRKKKDFLIDTHEVEFINKTTDRFTGLKVRRQKRSIMQDPVTVIPLPGGRTVSEIPHETFAGTSMQFTAGNVSTYGTYPNPPLIADRQYVIYFVVGCWLDGVTKMSYSQTTTAIRTLPDPFSSSTVAPRTDSVTSSLPVVTQGDTSNSVVVPVVVTIFVIIFIILVCIAAYFLWRWYRNKQRYAKSNALFGFRKQPMTGGSTLYENPGSSLNLVPSTLGVEEAGGFYDFSTMGFTGNSMLDVPVAELGKHPIARIEEEFRMLPDMSNSPATVGRNPQNQDCNRTSEIIAYDHSRVVVKPVGSNGAGGSDYYNADYVPDYHGNARAYIAAQSPFNKVTIRRFWMMVYQKNVTQIVHIPSAGNTAEFCPSDGVEQLHGNVIVKALHTEHFAHFIIRNFQIHNKKGSASGRHVKQYSFTEWPDDKTSSCDAIKFLSFQSKITPPSERGEERRVSPVLVHCCTGAVKTSAFIAVDTLLRQAHTENCVNVNSVCAAIRCVRMMAVPLQEHYFFIYDVLLEALATFFNDIGSDLKFTYRLLSEEDALTHESYFAKQLTDLNRSTTNRSDSASHKDLLTLDSYTVKNKYILTTTAEGWSPQDHCRFIVDNHITAVIRFIPTGGTDDQLLDSASNKIMRFGKYSLKLVASDDESFGTRRAFEISADIAGPNRQVLVWDFVDWSEKSTVPTTSGSLSELIEFVNDWQAKVQAMGVASSQSIISVQCRDGFTQSGLFCACHVICEKIWIDKHVDVYHTVKTMKMNKKEIITSLVTIYVVLYLFNIFQYLCSSEASPLLIFVVRITFVQIVGQLYFNQLYFNFGSVSVCILEEGLF